MKKKKAKLIFKHNYFEVIEEVIMFVFGFWKGDFFKRSKLLELDLKEAYFSPLEVNERYLQLKK